MLPLVAALSLIPAIAHADTDVVTQASPTSISAQGDVLAYSSYDAATQQAKLVVRRAGVVSEVPVAPSRLDFEADVGTGAQGQPVLAYSRCGTEKHSCDVYTYDLGRGALDYEGDGKVDKGASTALVLTDIRTNKPVVLSQRGSGESGQSWTSLSIDGGGLYAAFLCYGDPGGCGAKRSGPFRYDLAQHTWSHSSLDGDSGDFTVADGVTYESQAETDSDRCGPYDPKPGDDVSCHVVQRDPAPVYEAVKRP